MLTFSTYSPGVLIMSDYNYIDINKFEMIHGVMVPVDEDGHYLDWNDIRTDRHGKQQARELTSPYGSLEYAVGYEPDDSEEESEEMFEDDDWMRCFDYAELPDGRIVLHAVTNSDSGGFIEGSGYFVVVKEEAPAKAMEMVDEALDSLCFNDRLHDEEGWNQDPYYFVRSVMAACGIEPYASANYGDNRRGDIPKV
jgi:hypothetical protein